VIGARGDPALFDRFLADWQTVLARRTRTAVEAFAAVDGLAGLVLAGSVGRGEPWPLSDIDFLVVYDDGRTAEAGQEVERLRLAILDGWAREGWWTGLDLGRLVFERREVEAMLDGREPAALADDRWFHSVSKGYRGRAVHDLDGLAAALAAWATEHRFGPGVVALRLARWRREAEEALARARTGLHEEDPLAATIALRRGTAMLAAWLIERWGEHDSSFGRASTRLERAARARGQTALVDELHALADLDDPAVGRRLAAAPAWVRERHDRSYRARRRVGEEVTGVQDARDVLRVSTHYEQRRLGPPPYPAWLAVPTVPVLEERAERLAHLGDRVLADAP
jgi:predicted nucleotidyltransferase